MSLDVLIRTFHVVWQCWWKFSPCHNYLIEAKLEVSSKILRGTFFTERLSDSTDSHAHYTTTRCMREFTRPCVVCECLLLCKPRIARKAYLQSHSHVQFIRLWDLNPSSEDFLIFWHKITNHCRLWNKECVHRRRPLDPLVNYLNLFHNNKTTFFLIPFNITCHLRLDLANLLLRTLLLHASHVALPT